MTEQTKGTKSPMNTGAFKRVFSVLVVLLLAATLMVGAVSAEGEGNSAENPVYVSTFKELTDNLTAQKAFIELNADIYAEKQIDVTYAVTIDGGASKHKIIAVLEDQKWVSDNSNKHLLNIGSLSSGIVTLKNITFDSSASSAITDENGVNYGAYGVQAYDTGDTVIKLENVVLTNSAGSGFHLNGAKGALTNVVIQNSFWNQSIDLDSPDGKASSLIIDSLDGLKDITQITNEKKATEYVTVGEDEVKPTHTWNGYSDRNVWASDADYATKAANGLFVVQVEKKDSPIALYTYIDPELKSVKAAEALKNALTAAVDGDVVTLLKAVELTEQIAINTAITFDGANNAITAPAEANFVPVLITSAGDVTLKNVSLTANNLKAQSLVQAAKYESTISGPKNLTVQDSELRVTFHADAVATEDGNNLGVGANQFYGIFARPTTELVVKDSIISVTGKNNADNAYAIKFKPQAEANKLTVTITGNEFAVSGEKSADAIFAVTAKNAADNGMSATISGNTLTSVTPGIAKLVYYTPVANNTKMDIIGNTLTLNGAENYVLDVMLGKAVVESENENYEINLVMSGNTVTLGKTESTFSPVKVAQRGYAPSAGADNTIYFKGEISEDNKFAAVTSYIYQDTHNLDTETKTPVVLDTSGFTIEGEKKAFEIVVPYVNGINLSNTTEKTGKLTVKPEGTVVTWASDKEDVLTIDASGNYEAIAVGTATITATSVDGATNTTTITVYEEVTSQVESTATTDATGVVTITTTGTESVTPNTEDNTVSVESDSLTLVVPVISSSSGNTFTPDTDKATNLITEEVTVPVVSGMPEITVSIIVDLNTSKIFVPGSSTAKIVETLILNPERNETIINAIESTNDEHTVLVTLEVSVPAGQSIADFDAKIVDGEKTVRIPVNISKDKLPAGKLIAFHIDDNNQRTPVDIGNPVDLGTKVQYTIYSNEGFSSYAVVVDTTPAPVDPVQPSSGSSSSGSSTWLPSEPTQQPTQTPTEQPTDKPTDTVPTDIPSTQPTATPSTPGFGVLAVLAGLGAVAVLRRQ